MTITNNYYKSFCMRYLKYINLQFRERKCIKTKEHVEWRAKKDEFCTSSFFHFLINNSFAYSRAQ